jgi:polyisoprenyl-teichoic acid--peptidoglycan teichoic acid transferase
MPPKTLRKTLLSSTFVGLLISIGGILLGVVLIFSVLFTKISSFVHIAPGTLISIALGRGEQLKTTNGKTNILLLGVGGGTHDGPDLTDTILIVSLDMVGKKASMISIPRDVWSDTLKDKINSAYHYGEAQEKGNGYVLADAIVQEITGLKVNYNLLVDFSGFKNIIDLVGGIDIQVSQGFTDTEYPIDGKENDLCNGDPLYRCRYETITFTKGWQHMDGTTALKYVRSRHAQGEQGSDFARSRRQQDVVLALKQSVIKAQFFWKEPKKISSLMHAVDDATDTDMSNAELAVVGRYFAFHSLETVKKIYIDSLLYQPPEEAYDGRFVLVPKESLTAVQEYIKTEMR